ncbi:uncharacterized protein LOC118271391 [Spodoptera frugiperda]|uniref:Uncharacterized protein LOC118271391 n=1 Tax=Spodoptera frugiperda TaxID=7108 RepID=A0A9R0D7G2_SPOFR|nr:uncharacterized protein LOC118271391 [Spodoptera frugiperda]
MPRKPCYWTRKLELDLVDFVHQREYIWRPAGNTNHHIQQKYKAYAEFAAILGRGFTARSVRERWVNIRSTFNHNHRRVERSKLKAKTASDIYVPCWPLWKPLQFLKDVCKKEDGNFEFYESTSSDMKQLTENVNVKEEQQSEFENDMVLNIRQRSQRTDRPRHKTRILNKSNRKTKCKQIIDDLLLAMKPLASDPLLEQSYWFFGKHVTEQLNSMRRIDAESAANEIVNLLNE